MLDWNWGGEIKIEIVDADENKERVYFGEINLLNYREYWVLFSVGLVFVFVLYFIETKGGCLSRVSIKRRNARFHVQVLCV